MGQEGGEQHCKTQQFVGIVCDQGNFTFET